MDRRDDDLLAAAFDILACLWVASDAVPRTDERGVPLTSTSRCGRGAVHVDRRGAKVLKFRI